MSNSVTVNGNTYVWPDQFLNFQYVTTWPAFLSDCIAQFLSYLSGAQSAATSAASSAASAAGSASQAQAQTASAASSATAAASSATAAAGSASQAQAQATAAAGSAAAVNASLAAIASGPVASVNGKTGPIIVLTPSDLGAAPQSAADDVLYLTTLSLWRP